MKSGHISSFEQLAIVQKYTLWKEATEAKHKMSIPVGTVWVWASSAAAVSQS